MRRSASGRWSWAAATRRTTLRAKPTAEWRRRAEGSRRWSPALRARQLRNDAEALRCRSLAWSTERHGYEEALPRADVRCLFFAGDADQPNHDRCKAVSARMPQASFVSLPGLD